MKASNAAAPTTTAVAQAIDVVKVYGSGDTEVRALDDVTCSFPAGHFTEYDLPEEGASRLEPVHRPYGCNRAGVVVGVITNYNKLIPEGMRRVAILGDPTAGLGNIAEAECRRILAALDLDQELAEAHAHLAQILTLYYF